MKIIPAYQFPTSYNDIVQRLHAIEPKKYGRSRNFIDGALTYLSPYISRGIISTKQVANYALEQGHEPKQIEKFLQEFAWRDYWLQIWIARGDEINKDLRNEQQPVNNHSFPKAVYEGQTGITAIDQAIKEFYRSGYIHNHVRMYIAAIVCNMGFSHWKLPAQWMYYHLKDGDWASNALSWQWVSGANANKKYVANQSNINKYMKNDQTGTFLDVPYEAFNNWSIPDQLQETISLTLQTPLPETPKPNIEKTQPTFIYNWYNLDPLWGKGEHANRILLLEPSVFDAYPISQQSVAFMLEVAKNIENLQVFTAEFSELQSMVGDGKIIYKEHPLNKAYKGEEHPREWISSITGYHRSFFQFWKKVKKENQW